MAQFPYRILGVDSDNGSEFINARLLAYCIEEKITFTRASARADTTTACRRNMTKTMAGVRPGALCRQIDDLTAQLESMAIAKAPAPVKPSVNRAFNSSTLPEVLT